MTASSIAAAARRPLSFTERFDVPRRITIGSAGLVIFLVFLLLAFIAWNGVQIFTASHIPFSEVFSTDWNPSSSQNVQFGILPFISGTLGVMVVAAIISAPLSVGLALFMAEIAPGWARKTAQPAMEVFVGIPSVVYGWLGITILVPFLKDNLAGVGFTLGFSWFAGSLVLALMIMPTITSLSYDVFRTVPAELRSASLALGTTRWQTIRHVLIPASLTGIITAIVLGMMRAAGEALAVQMVIGNRPTMPTSLTEPMTTLTSQITLDMGNTVQGEAWNQALWTMGLVLLIISFLFVLAVRSLTGRRGLR
jgi:phosphate transport system permease protein